MDAIEELSQLSDVMRQASALLADEDVDETTPSSSRHPSTFLNVVALSKTAVVLCQVEKVKEDMLTKLYSSVSSQSIARIEELLMEDQNVKRRRERIQKQSSLFSKLTRQLSIHDNRATAASYANGNGGESTPTSSGPSAGDEWRTTFDAAANR